MSNSNPSGPALGCLRGSRHACQLLEWHRFPALPVVTETAPDRAFLFEAIGEGTGELVFEMHRGAELVGEIGSVWLDLKDINNLYEHYSCADLAGKNWEQINEILPRTILDNPATPFSLDGQKR